MADMLLRRFGTKGRIRTRIRLFNRQALYQLSYPGTLTWYLRQESNLLASG